MTDTKKRAFQGRGRKSKRRKIQRTPSQPGSNQEILATEVAQLLAAQKLSDSPDPTSPLPEPFSKIEVNVISLSSTGDGLATHAKSRHLYVVPYCLPGDVVQVKVVKHVVDDGYSLADFEQLVNSSPARDDSLVRCPYFGKCSGCQFQMMPYPDQLAHKKTIIEKAYAHFSGLDPPSVPAVGETIPSPMQYGYRTKLTPHFDGPPGYRSRKQEERQGWKETPPIGFMEKGTRRTIDIEDCIIGTDVVRMGLKRERKRVVRELDKYMKGATLLVRESTTRTPYDAEGERGDESVVEEAEQAILRYSHRDYREEKTCITDQNGMSTEFVSDWKFFNPANAFFQNNNSILPVFTAYIREHVVPRSAPDPNPSPPLSYLIDAYSGSGLFTITLSSLFKSSTGIDISASSIESARHNARENQIANAKFIAADAVALFKDVSYPPSETAVILDPPRKGCDGNFLSQLLAYGPKRIVYVSCNVHTQARDVGMLVRGLEEGEKHGTGQGHGLDDEERDGEGRNGDSKEEEGGESGAHGTSNVRYEMESLRGFDFFPQTSHVEAVAVLTRKEEEG
ncbi:MAG: tRNA(m5U54)methyltransferase [Thelocarpon superellum]|nr:MAG: tRNA(m5U54)methyltransferase [Thelocarpon superellum]